MVDFTFYLVVKSTSKCYDTVTEKYYREAELWQRDECTSCYCGSDRKPECTETACPPLFCEAPLKIKQRCCPVCPDTIQQGKHNYSIFWSSVSFCILCFYFRNFHSDVRSLGFLTLYICYSPAGRSIQWKLLLRSWKRCPRLPSLFMPVVNILLPFCPVLGYCSLSTLVISSFLASVYFHLTASCSHWIYVHEEHVQ